MAEQDVAAAVQEFHKAVNMTPAQIERWLGTEHSREASQKQNSKIFGDPAHTILITL